MNNKILFIFGTRPEAIKLAPLILQLKAAKNIQTKICVTGQHKELLETVLKDFGIKADYNLSVMEPIQELGQLTAKLIIALTPVLTNENPTLVVVQGDTTSAMCGALTAFYSKIPVAHVEAGLRSGDNYSPYPEEVNRKIISQIAALHFCPTKNNIQNLAKENIQTPAYLTGNTGIDAVKLMLDSISETKGLVSNEIIKIVSQSKYILTTIHRRENIPYLDTILTSLTNLSNGLEESKLLFILHPNPLIQSQVKAKLMDNQKVSLLQPACYPDMVYLMNKAELLITDSGGLQEEATYLGLPTIVVRKETERQEAIEEKLAIRVDQNSPELSKIVLQLMNNESALTQMSAANNIYGDGNSAKVITEYLMEYLKDL